ncbi:MAG TPA: PKD domain-containing protein [Chitinophagales bacterium]|nr:PKD domain-containing protein [Chitinophagales bacterium]
MKRTLTNAVVLIASFICISTINSCAPKDKIDLAHCTNGVKDSDEAGIDCGGSCNACVNLPTVCFTAPDSVQVNTNAAFTNCSQQATTYSWNFGDGQTSTLSAPTHSYSATGTYTVSLTGSNPQSSNTTTKSIKVYAVTINSSNYVGTYAMADVCPSGPYSGTCVISANGANAIIINNYGGVGGSANFNATINGNQLTIPSQTQGGFTISGTGTLSQNQLTINSTYTISEPSFGTESCTSVLTKQ